MRSNSTHWPELVPIAVHESPALIVLILMAGAGTGVLFLVSVLAYWRRRTRPYLLVSIALGALFARSLVGLATVLGFVGMTHHHLVEHTLDFLIAVLVILALINGTDRSDTSLVDE